jgi:haloalkane dehalogenase
VLDPLFYDGRVSGSHSVREAEEIAYREAGDGADVVVLLHGYPESSYMWRDAIDAAAEAGWRALAPDLPGFGDSAPDPPGTWERHMEALDRWVRGLGLDRIVLVTHDWGVPIGLRWACDNPHFARAFVISDGGFFADRRWHDMAEVMRTPGEGERMIEKFEREGFGAMMHAISHGMTGDAIDEYWKAFDGDVRRRAHLELYRSGEFDKLLPYEGRLAELALPTLIVWGGRDRFAGPKMAHRFHDEIPGSELVLIEDAGHFVWEDEPEATSRALVDFLRRLPPA